MLGNGEQIKGKFELTSGEKPQFDITVEGKPGARNERWRGIYDLSEKKFKAALSYTDNNPRPTEFTEQNTWNFEWKGEAKDLTPVDANYFTGVATWHYWRQFSGIRDRHNMTNPFENVSSPEQVIEQCGKASAILKEIRTDIDGISIAQVDPKVTAYAAQYVETLNEFDAIFREMSSIMKDAIDLKARSDADEVLGMTIIELFLGRPGATIDALDAEAQQLKNRMLAVRQRALDGGKISDQLGSEQLKLRSYLSDKYRREFRQFTL